MVDSPETGAEGPVSIAVLMDGTLIDDAISIVSIRTNTAIGRIPEAVVRMMSGSVASNEFPHADASTFEPGAEIEIKAGYASNNETIFKGVIVGKRMRVNSNTDPILEITARDACIALTGPRKTVYFENKKDSEVMSSIAADAGLSGDIAATMLTADQIQNDVTDWDFLRHLADRNDYVLHADAGKVVARVPDTSATAVLGVTLGVDLMDFDAEVDTQQLISGSSGAAWSSNAQERVSGEGGALPSQPWGNVTSETMAQAFATREHQFATSRDMGADALSALAKARLSRSALSAMRGQCVFQGSAKAKVGEMLDIEGVGDRFGGSAFMSGIKHELSDGIWQTTATLGLAPGWASDMPGFAAPAAHSIAAPIHGAHIATVTALTEDPAARLRIKVRLEMMGTDGSEVWARYAMPYASNGAGIQFMPEIGDEVVITFLESDPHAPIVIGAMHNGKAAQPNTPTDDNNIKAIVTRSDLQIRFDDDAKSLTLSTPGGHSVVLDDDAAVIKLEDSHGNAITMGSDGITLKSVAAINITAAGPVDVAAEGDATLSGANVSCNADASFEATGGAEATLSGGAQAKVVGALVMIN